MKVKTHLKAGQATGVSITVEANNEVTATVGSTVEITVG